MEEVTIKLAKVVSINGYRNPVSHPVHGILVPIDEVTCEICDLIGGYCGMCSGSHWNERVEVLTQDLRAIVCP